MTKKHLRISILGAGKVGTTLGRLAYLAGYEIGDVVCRSRASARKATRFIGAGYPQAAARATLSRSDLILISTPDDRIPDAVRIILRGAELPAGPVKRRTAGRIVAPSGLAPAVIHTSGALSSSVLEPLRSHGTSIGSCHPLQTFQSPAGTVSLIGRSYFCIEGDDRAKLAAGKLVRDVGGRCFEIRTQMKPLYHAAAVLASGGLISLLSISLEALAMCGLEERDARRVLSPLIQGTVANLEKSGPARALTGPVPRRDTGTIERNMRALSGINQNWLAIYELLTERCFELLCI